MPEVDPEGSVTSPLGFLAGATYTGIKSYGDNKLDVGILASSSLCSAAAVFTRNRLHSASIHVNRAHLADHRAQAVFVNSGIANSSTGERGIADARQISEWVGAQIGVAAANVLVCSTGVIGPYLPMDKVQVGVTGVGLSALGGPDFSRAILTTDTHPKAGSVRFGPYLLGGCAKGAGMIHPNMATMLAFLTTDAPVATAFLESELRRAVDGSFNLVSVDGDTSPSDTVILMASGEAGGDIIDSASPAAPAFSAALDSLCTYLAKSIARDGEGATKLIEITVRGAATYDDARQLIHTVATSYLVKSAVYGADPNWGRLVACLGRSGVEFREADVSVSLSGQVVFAHERPTEFDAAALSQQMRSDTVPIEFDLGAGDITLTGWGCDLTEEYVRINAEYTT
ncbi:MAG: bifunctional glutamate N-acetyltransferase/amino-acid acetyltransferase ArgJ [Dehalococcoidia bacterium]